MADRAVVARNGNGNGGSLWTVIAVAAGIVVALLQALWLIVWGQLNAQNDRLQHEIDRISSVMGKEFVRVEEIKRVDVNLSNQRDRLTRMTAELLTKDAYNGRHEALIDEVKRQTARIDEIQRTLGSAITLNDKFKELQDQIKAIQEKAYIAKGKTDPP